MENTKKRNIPSNLPEVEFVDTNTEALVNKLIAGYEEITGRTLYPADPVRAFILWLASVLVQERVQINESAKQNLPRYAVGKNLDSLVRFSITHTDCSRPQRVQRLDSTLPRL